MRRNGKTTQGNGKIVLRSSLSRSPVRLSQTTIFQTDPLRDGREPVQSAADGRNDRASLVGRQFALAKVAGAAGLRRRGVFAHRTFRLTPTDEPTKRPLPAAATSGNSHAPLLPLLCP